MSALTHDAAGRGKKYCTRAFFSLPFGRIFYCMCMIKRISWMFGFFVVAILLLLGIASWFFLRPQEVPELTAAQPAVRSLVEDMLAARKAELLSAPDDVFGSEEEINILTLGIDSRKEGTGQHCDAIHLVTLNIEEWTIRITSVPRGTYAALPGGGKYQDTDYYIANACAFGGLEYGIAQIEKITGVKADYVATVGFSQALGIFRTIGLPTTETLQWLRHRQSYAIGDPQRSQNQATFMKDVALQLLEGDGISTPLLYILYTFIDTDLTFDQVHSLYLAYLASGIDEQPERISFDMKPHYDTEIYHFDALNADEQIDTLLEHLQGRLSEEDLSNKSLAEIQRVLIDYLYDMLGSKEQIAQVYRDQLWRQVEDAAIREELHYRFLEKYVREVKNTDREAAVQVVTDYVLEMQFFGLEEWEARGKNIMRTLVDEEVPLSSSGE
jgi:anionic cell wall polymer biosynthesis LytR-Cps2A-Psr (LCP) family protein